MITILHKLSRLILNIVAWPIMIAAIIMSGVAWSGDNWQFVVNGSVNINSIIFIAGICIFGLNIISIIIRPLRKISKVIFSIASFLTIGFVAYSFAQNFAGDYNWTINYTSKESMFWGFGFIAIVAVMCMYLITGFVWLSSIGKKNK